MKLQQGIVPEDKTTSLSYPKVLPIFCTPADIETEAIVALLFEGQHDIHEGYSEINEGLRTQVAKLIQSGEVTGRPFEATIVHQPSGLCAERLLIMGLGKAESFDLNTLRKISSAAIKFLNARNIGNCTFWLRQPFAEGEAARIVAEGSILGSYEPQRYQSAMVRLPNSGVVGICGLNDSRESAVTNEIWRGVTIAEAQNFTRDLVNEPSNRLTPTMLADRAAVMAREAGLSVDILDEKRMAEFKMGAILSVAQGSSEPPRLIVVTYTPAKPRAGAPVIGLVGKAITFDTGGISIKPAEGMEKMKYDMAGGATMLGVMRAVAVLKPTVKVIAVVPAAENMPGGRAQKPGDVQIAMSGKSIEVINTDAEGRLVLADGLTYARQLGCTHLIDAATLSGATVAALGPIYVGLFTSDADLRDRILSSGRSVGEKIWPLPVDDEYSEFLKSECADIRNIASVKMAGAPIGAMFLKEFVGDSPWAHLDIAGVAWWGDSKPWAAKGASGVAVRTLVDLVMNL